MAFCKMEEVKNRALNILKILFALVVDEVNTACEELGGGGADLVRIFQISLAHIQNILSQSPCRVLKRNNTIVCTAVCLSRCDRMSFALAAK